MSAIAVAVASVAFAAPAPSAAPAQSDPEWKYVPVRRYAAFVEESVGEGASWVVFEPED